MNKVQFYFLDEEQLQQDKSYVLDTSTSYHLCKVLRHKEGDRIVITNGKGIKANASITQSNERSCKVTIIHTHLLEPHKPTVRLGVSLLRNINRWEWMIEKAVELGVHEIFPLWCEHTESKQHLKIERTARIILAAMLQSQSVWLPKLHPPMPFNSCLAHFNKGKNIIAHCDQERNRVKLGSTIRTDEKHINILIGPEGDFSTTEITLAEEMQYTSVSLGDKRLRSETAAIYALSKLL